MQRIMKNVRSKYLFATGIVLQFPYLGKYYLGKNQESSCQTVGKFSTAFSFTNLFMGDTHAVNMSQTHAAIMTQAAREINFDHPVLTVKGLEAKYETVPISNSLAVVLGSYQEALIAQNLNNAGGAE